MTFLAKVGSLILKGIQIINGFEPMVRQLDPKADAVVQTVSADLAQIANIIVTVEAMGQSLGLPGTDKLHAAAPQVAQIILQSSVLAGHQIANPSLFDAGARKIADGMADCLNALHPASVQATDKTNLTPVNSV